MGLRSYRHRRNHFPLVSFITSFGLEKPAVSKTVVELPDLPLVPAGNPGEVPRNSRDSIHIRRTTVITDIRKPAARPMATVTRSELRAKGDLIIVGLLKGLDHEIGEGFL